MSFIFSLMGLLEMGNRLLMKLLKSTKEDQKRRFLQSSMMQPRAEDLLKELADRSGGDFSVVMEDGETKKENKKKR